MREEPQLPAVAKGRRAALGIYVLLVAAFALSNTFQITMGAFFRAAPTTTAPQLAAAPTSTR